jgi:DNA gyrase subunit A
MGRATQVVRLINIKGNDSIAAVTKVMKEDEVADEEGAVEDGETQDDSTETTTDATTDDGQE